MARTKDDPSAPSAGVHFYSSLEDVPIKVGALEDGRPMPFGPWGLLDGVTAAVGAGLTGWIAWTHLQSGKLWLILSIGVLLTAGAVIGARSLIPTGRPGVAMRLVWFISSYFPAQGVSPGGKDAVGAGRERKDLTRPRAVANLRFTPNGVFAEFLVSGVSYNLRRRSVQERVAKLHMGLLDALPSGFQLEGLTAATTTADSIRRMLAGHRYQEAWVQECVEWEPFFDESDPSAERLYWLSVPVDHGAEGRTSMGELHNAWDWIRGRDLEAASTIAEFIEQGDEFIAALPSDFGVFAVTPDLIRWHWDYHATRGGTRLPLPEVVDAHEVLEPHDFTPIYLDEGDQAHHHRRFIPSRWCGVRTSRAGADDGYQATLTLTRFDGKGMAFPGSEIFQVVDDELLADKRSSTVTADTYQYISKTPIEVVMRQNARLAKNIKDQQTQQQKLAEVDPTLARTGEDLQAFGHELSSSQREWRVNMTAWIVVAGPSRRAVDRAVKTLTRNYSSLGVRVDAWAGPQAKMFAASLPGNVKPRTIERMSHPTTRENWARTVPLVSQEIGNATGVPFARVTSSALSPRVFIDLSGASRRGHSGVIVFGGDPGGGKSYQAKRVTKSEVKRGAQAVIMDPGTEWAVAFDGFPGALVVNLAAPDFSMDMLRTFPPNVAGTIAADHILPLLEILPTSQDGARFRLAVSETQRKRNGIESMADLVDYLAKAFGETCELVTKLRSWQVEPIMRSVFDPTLPVKNLTEAPVLVWLTGDLDLQEIDSAAALSTMSTTQKAGQALYGLAAAGAERTFYSRPDQFGFLVTEEDRAWLATEGGRKTAHLLTRRGRRTWSGWISITQNGPGDHEGMGDEFIKQKVIFRTADEQLAPAHLRWAGVDPDEYPSMVEKLREDTSPPDLRRAPANLGGVSGEAEMSHGRPIAGREGEAIYVDEFGRTACIQTYSAISERDRAVYETNPDEIAKMTADGRLGALL